MFTASPELYDILYSSFKDYGEETNRIAALLGLHHPDCRSLLDVGCGTGEHARLLMARGFEVDGLDLDPNLLGVARAKNPTSCFYEGDMCTFALKRRYDAVLCLFSSIGYVRTLNRLGQALTCFHHHLAPNGVVIIEPWFTPDALNPGHTTSQTVEAPEVRITRTSQLEVVGRISRVTFRYEVTGSRGTKQATELHELGLFTVDEMQEAFRAAGLIASYDATGLTGRGLYVGRAAA